MTGLLGKLAVKFLKGRWGQILPALFKAAGEGKFGPAVKRLYWLGNGYATFTGAVFVGVGAGLEAVTAAYPEWAWAPVAAVWVYRIGTFLFTVGLLRGGVNSPWPAGSPIAPEEKQG